MTKNSTTKQEWQKNEKKHKEQKNNKKMTKINHQQPSEFCCQEFHNCIHI
jgi:hypothetical protein